MMCGMMGGMVWISIISTVMVLGYAYIVWVLANKEAGAMKLIGQVIAIIIVLVALTMLFYGSRVGYAKGEMMKNPEMQKQMMQMQKMMQQQMKK